MTGIRVFAKSCDRGIVDQAAVDENLKSVVGRVLDSMPGVAGETYLIKVNMVDPSIPAACTDPAAVQIVADELNNRSANEVLVGDEPAQYIFENMAAAGITPDIMAMYAQAGYHEVTGVQLVDLNDLATPGGGMSHFDILRRRPDTCKEEVLSVPVRHDPGVNVISLTLPKQHGNYGYSGVMKNLMGLVPHDQRGAYFHDSVFPFVADVMTGIVDENKLHDKVYQLCAELGENPHDRTRGLVAPAYNAHLDNRNFMDEMSLIAHLDHVINVDAIHALNDWIGSRNPLGFGVLDGMYVLQKHEHHGTPLRANFALASDRMSAIDKVAVVKIGLQPSHVPYVNQVSYGGAGITVSGAIGENLPGQNVLPREMFNSGAGYFLRVK